MIRGGGEYSSTKGIIAMYNEGTVMSVVEIIRNGIVGAWQPRNLIAKAGSWKTSLMGRSLFSFCS